jgi:hypothetical protein
MRSEDQQAGAEALSLYLTPGDTHGGGCSALPHSLGQPADWRVLSLCSRGRTGRQGPRSVKLGRARASRRRGSGCGEQQGGGQGQAAGDAEKEQRRCEAGRVRLMGLYNVPAVLILSPALAARAPPRCMWPTLRLYRCARGLWFCVSFTDPLH